MAESLTGEPEESQNASSRNPLGNRIRYVSIQQKEGHEAHLSKRVDGRKPGYKQQGGRD
jgi:hypothetical protein